MSDLMEQINKLKEELAAFQSGGVQAVENLKNKQEENGMKDFNEGLSNIEKAVKDLKPREATKAEKQLDQFLGTEFDIKLAKAKEKFLGMSSREQAEFRKNNPELYEKMFPTPKVEMPKPNNYDAFKKLVMQNEKDVAKLPYSVRLYAKMNDPEFDSYITVADASLQAKQNTNAGNPLLKKLKEMEAAKKAQG